MLLVLGLVTVAWALVRLRSSARDRGSEDGADRPQDTSHDRSREILRERYARGEISEEEMRERMRALDER
ncbi:hypothetical protein GCM10009841_06020 [Microlunatus panaciterrae]|uniref:Membrane protein n=1 Tax=Microlunatus panaciterrae TaxID=400768 RepID=A0ABS2RJ68_9ACTN|nr:hypothetical protein [Microlunatus panaciterrae]MBM7798743.1 putative membrane protein [Microlunatus panaciterrae]